MKGSKMFLCIFTLIICLVVSVFISCSNEDEVVNKPPAYAKTPIVAVDKDAEIVYKTWKDFSGEAYVVCYKNEVYGIYRHRWGRWKGVERGEKCQIFQDKKTALSFVVDELPKTTILKKASSVRFRDSSFYDITRLEVQLEAESGEMIDISSDGTRWTGRFRVVKTKTERITDLTL